MDDILKKARGELDDLVSAVDSTQSEAHRAMAQSYEASKALEDVEEMIEDIVDTHKGDIKERDDRIEELETEKDGLQCEVGRLDGELQDALLVASEMRKSMWFYSSSMFVVGAFICAMILL